MNKYSAMTKDEKQKFESDVFHLIGEGYHTKYSIAKELRVSPFCVQQALNALEAKGLIYKGN